MPKPLNHSRTQTIISYLIISLLIFIAIAVFIKQKNYQKPELLPLDTVNDIPDSALLTSDLFNSDFTSPGPVEYYNPDNLYEKINGKADLYLNNDFASLQCRRFIDKSVENNWAEVYLYDMGQAENAFAVYSLQKREDSVTLGWAQFGYFTTDSIYFAAGKYYIEIFLSSEDDKLLTSAKNAAKQLSSNSSAGTVAIPTIALFPVDNLVDDSFKFIKTDAFSCSELKNIFSAKYEINDSSITAYLTRTDPAETFKKYYQFLTDNGANPLDHNIKLPNCQAVELFGTTEIFFITGSYFAGVRGSVNMKDLEQIANNLTGNLAK
ncbi:MAG: hypothetical protein JW806_10445 [Sedimentisphaerales bacterium]|nr:hypothetical protein [Sedimentisphaerales bacterium]